MAVGPWDGDWPISAGWRYSSGALHAAWDVAMPRGTNLYALGDGVIVDCEDGHPDPAPSRYSGMPSNWIILKYTFPGGPYKGKTGYVYLQHLTKGGVKVKRGQKVKQNDRIGVSGSSGNSSGPHLHIVPLKPGYTMNRDTRYAYMSNPNMVVWEPSAAWGNTDYGKDADMPLSEKDINKIAKAVWGYAIDDPLGVDNGQPVKNDTDKAETMLRNIRRDTGKK